MNSDVGVEKHRGQTEDDIIWTRGESTADLGKGPPRFRGYGVIVLVLLGLLVAGAGLMTVSGEARRQFALSFVPKFEPYTELYFSEQRPVEIVDGPAGGSVRVRFTVANHEGRAEALRYSVRVVDGAEVPLGVVSGIAEMSDRGVATVTSTIPVPAAAPWSAVEVALDGRPERLRLLRAQVDAMAR